MNEAFKVHSFENDLYHCQRTLSTRGPENKNATSEHDSVQKSNGWEKKKRGENLGEILYRMAVVMKREWTGPNCNLGHVVTGVAVHDFNRRICGRQ
jgi:hypothetical protein